MTGNSIDILAEAFTSLPFPVIYLDFRSVDRFLYRIRDLPNLCDHVPEDLAKRLAQCHLYMICRRPRLSIVPNTITWDADSISLKVSCTVKNKTHTGDVKVARPAELQAAEMFAASPFPHRELCAFDRDGVLLAEMLFANLAHTIPTLPVVAKKLEVLYVGKGLKKNTQDRLLSHATLQKVLAEINSDDPESEVFALVYRFDYRRSAGGIPPNNIDPIDLVRQKSRPYTPSLDEQVSLIEAATISYFRTDKHNSHYINFPNNDTDGARRARDAGAAYIVVQIDTENIGGVEIYSEHINPAATHHIVHRIAK